MHDVARLAGVSHQTVSRVINDHPSVSQSTRARVLEAMSQLDYRPNTAARSLVTNRSRRIGVISFDARYFGPGSTLHAIEIAAREAGYGISLASLSDLTDEDAAAAVAALDAHNVDGLIVIAPTRSAIEAVRGVADRVPLVALESEFRPDRPVVAVDQLRGAQLATQHLLELGHRTVFHIAGPSDWREAELRVEGWRDALAEAGVRTPPLLRGDWSPASGYRIGRQLVERSDVTAVFAANDQMALGVLRAFSEHGIDVPADCSIVGFDDIPEAEYFIPPLTTVRQNFDEVGRAGLQALVAEMERPDPVRRARTPVLIPPMLILRASTAPARAARRATR